MNSFFKKAFQNICDMCAILFKSRCVEYVTPWGGDYNEMTGRLDQLTAVLNG